MSIKKKEQGIFSKKDLFDQQYQVKFFLESDSLTETYRVEVNGENKILKLIKPSMLNQLDLDQFSKMLESATFDNNQVLKISSLASFTHNDAKIYYYLQEFVAGESLKSLLNREVYLSTYQACKITLDLLDIFHNIKYKENIEIIPENIYLEYHEQHTTVKILPINFSTIISKDYEGASRLAIAYSEDNYQFNQYSIATLLFRCLTGRLPWDYGINWTSNFYDITKQVKSIRTKHLLVQTDFETLIRKELARILYQVIIHKKISNFKNELQEFFDSSFEFKPSTFQPKRLDKIESAPEGYGLSQVAGMTNLKKLLHEDIIKPLRDKNTYSRYGIEPLNGILLYGPPGCGKTFIARQIAQELGHSFFDIKPSDIASTYVHGTQEKIGKLFQEAKLSAPAIIFIDEVDAILPARDSQQLNQHYSAEVNEFLAQLTDCNHHGIIVIMATNRPDAIDKAILRTGRIDKTVYIELPDFESRQAVLKLLLNDRPTDEQLDFYTLALRLSGYSFSDIKFIVNEVAKIALTNNSLINDDYFSEILINTRPSVDYEQIEKYENFSHIT